MKIIFDNNSVLYVSLVLKKDKFLMRVFLENFIFDECKFINVKP